MTAFDGFGDILKPEGSVGGVAGVGGVPAAPATVSAPTTVSATQPGKIISGDLDMSLSSLVDNLNIKGPMAQK